MERTNAIIMNDVAYLDILLIEGGLIGRQVRHVC